jgi:uncharacterized protein (AIM24 family)
MAAIGGFLRWLARKGLLFLALFAAILFYHWAHPSFESFTALSDSARRLEAGRAELSAAASGGIDAANARIAAAGTMGREAIVARRDAAVRDRAAVAGSCGSDVAALLTGGADRVIANRRACFAATLLTREIATLDALLASVDARKPGESVDAAIARHRRVIAQASAFEAQAAARREAMRRDMLPDVAQGGRLRQEEAVIAVARGYRTRAGTSVAALERTRGATLAATRAAEAGMAEAAAAYRALTDDRAKALSGNLIHRARAWAEANEVPRALRAAGAALLLILLTPLLIRLFCYYVLAPLAMRRAAIRVRVPGGSVAIAPAERSATSVGVRLDEGWELLVRQDYLQTTSQAGAKGTQWLLDWRHPVASIATGLTFLTRIRGAGEVTTVSATRDPFAEVTVLALPEGGACVLHPRALAAVAQPIGRPLRVSSHWRLFSLNAWLTLQLRYLVLHGPARLVVKGGRGIRVERAERGRVFGQDQLVGFSADLAYSVTRAETFWPYLLGRESLLKDRVAAGDGVLVVEEAPFAGRRAKGPARGIEGMIDAGMKMFGM